MFLGDLAGLFHGLGALGRTGRQLLRFVLDFLVETLQGREDGTLQVLLSVKVHIDHSLGRLALRLTNLKVVATTDRFTYLSVGTDVLKHRRNASNALREMVPLFQGIANGLSSH